MHIDEELKRLLRDLGHAINESVSESERIAHAVSSIRAAGYDIVLKLDATIGLARRPSQETRMTLQDRRFLESLRVRTDDDILEEEADSQEQEFTPQDIKFLRSLRISLDDER